MKTFKMYTLLLTLLLIAAQGNKPSLGTLKDGWGFPMEYRVEYICPVRDSLFIPALDYYSDRLVLRVNAPYSVGDSVKLFYRLGGVQKYVAMRCDSTRYRTSILVARSYEYSEFLKDCLSYKKAFLGVEITDGDTLIFNINLNRFPRLFSAVTEKNTRVVKY